MIPIKHLFHINSSQDEVFDALTNPTKLSAWYTSKVEGGNTQGDQLTFSFGEMKFIAEIEELVHGEKLVWKGLQADVPVEGHRFIFELDRNGDKTRVRFTHEGYDEQDDSYANMNYSWGKYLESLRQFCQKGKGEAFGTPAYRI